MKWSRVHLQTQVAGIDTRGPHAIGSHGLLVLVALSSLTACSAYPSAAAQLPEQSVVSDAEHPTLSVSEPQYPVPMRGLWMPQDLGCPNPINYDSETLLSVGADMLGQYENTTKPLRIEYIGGQPATWRILSTFSPGTGEYEGRESIIYSVDGDTLTIDNGNDKSAFTRCK